MAAKEGGSVLSVEIGRPGLDPFVERQGGQLPDLLVLAVRRRPGRKVPELVIAAVVAPDPAGNRGDAGLDHGVGHRIERCPRVGAHPGPGGLVGDVFGGGEEGIAAASQPQAVDPAGHGFGRSQDLGREAVVRAEDVKGGGRHDELLGRGGDERRGRLMDIDRVRAIGDDEARVGAGQGGIQGRGQRGRRRCRHGACRRNHRGGGGGHRRAGRGRRLAKRAGPLTTAPRRGGPSGRAPVRPRPGGC